MYIAWITYNYVDYCRFVDHVSSFYFHAGDRPDFCCPDDSVLQMMFSGLSRIIEMSWNNSIKAKK